MAFDWGAVGDNIDIYAEPTGFGSPIGEGFARLAGTSVGFSQIKLIAAEDGARVAEKIVPQSELSPALAPLPEKHRDRLAVLASALSAPRAPLKLGPHGTLALDQPRVMGIVNVTPDSFSDGGETATAEAAIARGRAWRAAGADIVDVGGESTRPGAAMVWEGDEIKRVGPVVAALAQGGPVSIDSRKAEVMRHALEKGAVLVNDVSALRYDEGSLKTVADAGVPVVLMHMAGRPEDMQSDPRYDDVLLDIFDFFEQSVAKCVEAGMEKESIILDPGIGFGKTVRHNLALINGLALFHGLGCAVAIGVSRKRFIGALADEEVEQNRLPGSLAASLAALDRGAHMIRVHDVAETVQAVAIWRGMRDEAQMPPA